MNVLTLTLNSIVDSSSNTKNRKRKKNKKSPKKNNKKDKQPEMKQVKQTKQMSRLDKKQNFETLISTGIENLDINAKSFLPKEESWFKQKENEFLKHNTWLDEDDFEERFSNKRVKVDKEFCTRYSWILDIESGNKTYAEVINKLSI